MPPKNKYSKEEIVKAAYELVREKGIDALAAREVGKRLNTSSSPIFTVFNSMDELKAEVYKKTIDECSSYLFECYNYDPAFKEFGLRFVKYAIDEPNLYLLLFNKLPTDEKYQEYAKEFEGRFEPLINEIMKSFKLDRDDAQYLFKLMIIHGHGIGSLIVNHVEEFTMDEVSRNISAVAIGLVIEMRTKKNQIDLDGVKDLIAHPALKPQKIK